MITHASDDWITEKHQRFLDDVRVLHWFAQSVVIRHPKLTAIPAGLANRQFPHGDINALVEIMKQRRPKTRDVYLNVDVRTNVAHREPIIQAMANKPFVTTSPPRPYRDYLQELAEHRFIISPWGNGLDSHRNWETIYLNTIPIIPGGIWMEEYQDLPILPVSQWEKIDQEFLQHEEARIRSEHRPLDKVLLSYWRNRIWHAVTRRETGSFV